MSDREPRPELDSVFARNLDWNLLKLFHEIVRSGGISAASRSVNKQQPSVSAGLKRLEDHLGLTLCERTSRGISLNPAGRAVFALCEEIEAKVRSLPMETAKASGALEGVISVRMISDIISPHFEAATIIFHRAHPGVEIRLDIAPWRSVVAGVKSGEVDIGIACDSVPSEALHYEPLLSETQQLYCSRSHPLYDQPVCNPRDLADQQFVRTGQDEPDELEHFRRRYGLGRRVGGSAETLHEVKRLIHLGIGIGFLPTIVAQAPGEPNDLWPLLPVDLLPSYQVYLITKAHSSLSPHVRTLLDMICATA
jgi:LysR family transcriptional regulator, transcriptional activator for bauABCD operon